MDTYFASPKKSSEDELNIDIEIIGNHPITSGLLEAVDGLLAIVNENRQVVSINSSLLDKMNLQNHEEVSGLRLGEVLNCVHSNEFPHGCGTTKYCSSCGAAIAMAVCLELNINKESVCSIHREAEGEFSDIYLSVKAHPIKIYGNTFVLLFLTDITKQQKRVALERVFFHDVNNMLTGLLGSSEILASQHKDSKLAQTLYSSALRLSKEIEIQKLLIKEISNKYEPLVDETSVYEILKELEQMYKTHTASKNKNVKFDFSKTKISLETDVSLVLRVLSNMITNALEATQENGIVNIYVLKEDIKITFYVWNEKVIPNDVALRVFQRNFSTKEGDGRGLGTYSMKFFGEEILNGKVGFQSSDQKGTTFFFSLPIN